MQSFTDISTVQSWASQNKAVCGPFSAILITHPSLDATPTAVEMGTRLSLQGKDIVENWGVTKWGGRTAQTHWSGSQQRFVMS